MRFRRKDRAEQGTDHETPESDEQEAPAPAGPRDFDDLDLDPEDPDFGYVDLGGLLLPPPPEGYDLQLQVDESQGTVMAVLIAGKEGALELRVFAAGRSSSMWEDVRRDLATEATRVGGTSGEREGDFGPEVTAMVPVTTDTGEQVSQPSRVIGIDGSRWFLRAMLLGRPAFQPETGGELEEYLRSVVVRRGAEAMPQGEPLPLRLPPEARRQG